MSDFYAKGAQAFAEGDIDWVADDVRAALIDTAQYTVNLSTHQFYSDIPSGAKKALVTIPAGGARASAPDAVLDGDDVTFASVSSGPPCGAIAIVQYGNVGGTITLDTQRRLIVWIDQATGLPVTPNGSNIPIVWDNGANKIARL